MSDKTIDLRSDTITLPTKAMQEAMACAPLGDDVYGEDPSVNRLQEVAAEKVGMEAALYVPSGTMGNACALMTHTNWGDEVLFEEQAHMYYWEAGTYASLAGLSARIAAGEHGRPHRRPSPRDGPRRKSALRPAQGRLHREHPQQPRRPRLVGRRGGRGECCVPRTRSESCT